MSEENNKKEEMQDCFFEAEQAHGSDTVFGKGEDA